MGDIGYGRPPEEHQFKPGQSGNPKGRPKGSMSLKSILLSELALTMEAKEDGKTVKMTKGQAAVKVLVARALSGQPHAMRQLLALMAAYLAEPEGAEAAEAPLAEADAALLEAYVKRVTGGDNGGNSDG